MRRGNRACCKVGKQHHHGGRTRGVYVIYKRVLKSARCCAPLTYLVT